MMKTIFRGEIEPEKEKIPTVFAEIRPDEIPDVPFQKFLYRGKPDDDLNAGDARYESLLYISFSFMYFILPFFLMLI